MQARQACECNAAPVAAQPAACFGIVMTAKRGKAERQAARRVRLSAALRENLKRRKQQARDRAAADPSGRGDGSAGKAVQSAGSIPDFRRNRGEE